MCFNKNKKIENVDYNINNFTLVSAIPLYLKYHSNGEFIFDQTWSNYAENILNIQYYPKV